MRTNGSITCRFVWPASQTRRIASSSSRKTSASRVYRSAPRRLVRRQHVIGIAAAWVITVPAAALLAALSAADDAQAQQAYGRAWGHTYTTLDWDRFYHYPYVYYPQNFWGNEYYRSADSLYFRYPPEMRIPVYNRHWFNHYPTPRPYHRGHHFVLDIF